MNQVCFKMERLAPNVSMLVMQHFIIVHERSLTCPKIETQALVGLLWLFVATKTHRFKKITSPFVSVWSATTALERALSCLTALIRREVALPGWHERNRKQAAD